MASPLSAILFRLGFQKKSKAWVAEWVVPKRLYFTYLQKTLSLFFFIKYFFSQYTTPLFQKTFLRNTTNEENAEITGEENIIKNVFIELSFLYAKTNIYCGIRLQVVVTLYDTLMEQLRNNLLFYKRLINKIHLMFKTIIAKKKNKRYYLINKKTLNRKRNRKLPKKQITRIIKKINRKLRLQSNINENIFYAVNKKFYQFKKKYSLWGKKHYISKRYVRLIKRIKRKKNRFAKNARKKWFINKAIINKYSKRFSERIINTHTNLIYDK